MGRGPWGPLKAPKLLDFFVFWHQKIFKHLIFPKPFYRFSDGLGWSFGDSTGTLAPMGTHVVALGQCSPPPRPEQLLLFGLFSGSRNFRNFYFFRNPCVSFGMGLGVIW